METKLELREAQLLEDDYALGACCYVFEYLFETPRLSLAIIVRHNNRMHALRAFYCHE